MIRSPYIRSRKIDGGAIALIRDDGTFRVNVWNGTDDTFQDVEAVAHDNSPEGRLTALRLAREFYRSIIDSSSTSRATSSSRSAPTPRATTPRSPPCAPTTGRVRRSW